MDSRSETLPLLRSFENETWKTKARRRCLRVPSEVTITGLILGLFVIVATVIIVLQDMEGEKTEELAPSNKLLASPLKYNKKIEDKTFWLDRKAEIIEMKKQKLQNYKWDAVNKGWKTLPDISGKISSSDTGGNPNLLKQNSQALIFPADKTEYGKEIDDDLESLSNLVGPTKSSIMKKFNQDIAEVRSLLHSGIKWKDVDEGWKTLSEKGWKDKDIIKSLFMALKEKRKELMDTEGVLQSPLNLNDILNKISGSWKESIQGGNKEVDHQKKINDAWKNKMSVQQSPKSSFKQYIKEDESQQDMDDSGTSEQASHKSINDEWKNKFNILQSSSKANYNKWKDAAGYKKKKYEKESDVTENVDDKTQQPPVSFEVIMEKIIRAIMVHLKESNSEETKNGDNQLAQSPTNSEDFIEKIIAMIKDQHKGVKDENSKVIKTDDNQPMQSPADIEDFIVKIIDKIKDQQKGVKDENSNVIKTDDNQPMQSPADIEDFIVKIIDKIKDQQKGNKGEKQKDVNNNMQALYTPTKKDSKWNEVNSSWKIFIEHVKNRVFSKNGGDGTPSPTDGSLQHSMSISSEKLPAIDDSWKKITGQDWEDLKEAVYKASNDGDKLLQSAMGDNSWKWKKVNDGWKKISNKS